MVRHRLRYPDMDRHHRTRHLCDQTSVLKGDSMWIIDIALAALSFLVILFSAMGVGVDIRDPQAQATTFLFRLVVFFWITRILTILGEIAQKVA